MSAQTQIEPVSQTRKRFHRSIKPSAALGWLGKGWVDLRTMPVLSIVYGGGVFALSVLIIGGMIRFGLDYILLPALSGFMVLGPLLAVGLYEKSRRIAAGEPVSLLNMIFVKVRSGGQILFVGVLLCLLWLLWLRAAVLLYALFFGLRPFDGFDQIAQAMLNTPEGWALLLVGSVVGGLFAAFSFAISAVSIPMLLDQKSDAFTAMGTSIALVWHNLPVMITWAAIVLLLFAISVASGLLGLIITFPLLGHSTWHAYRALQ